MRISIAEAEGQLSELVRLAHLGEEVMLTQDNHVSARLEPVGKPTIAATEATLEILTPFKLANKSKTLSPAEKLDLIHKLQESVRQKNLPSGPDAARSQDFLYDEDGLPG